MNVDADFNYLNVPLNSIVYIYCFAKRPESDGYL